MYCRSCGTELNEHIMLCPSCGEKVDEDIISAFDYQDHSSNRKVINGAEGAKMMPSKYLYLTMVLGMLSIIFSALNYLNLPFVHMIGIVLGIVVLSLASSDRKAGRIYSVLGVITGVIGLSLGIVAFLYGFFTSLI